MRLLALALFSLMASYASADTFLVEVEVPRQRVAEYHAPYVAFWAENADRSTIVPLGLWYDDQEKWLKDIRQWWRRTGRSQQKPYDGLTGATRSPGKHPMDFSDLQSLQNLAAGDYQLVVEASREVGGREVVRLPFQWPAKNHQQRQVDGTSELGTVTLSVKP